MNPLPTPNLTIQRLPLLLLACLAVAATLWAPGVGAGPQLVRGEVVSLGAKPFTESVAQMRRRDLARRASSLAANLSPSHWANPAHPKPPKSPFVQDPSQFSPQGFFLPSSAPTPNTLGANFAGIGMQDQISQFFGWSYPPDTMGAVGPNHFVQVINGSLAIYNKQTGTRLSHITLNSFFTFTANSVNYPRNGAFDPRVVYDRNSGRWYVCALEFGLPTASGFTANNQLLLAVSRTSDPTGLFDKYALTVGEPTVGTTGGFTDYPTLGVDSNGVYASVRIFTFNTNTGSFGSSFAKLVATPLSTLIAGSPSLGTVTVLSNISDMYSTPQPAVNLDVINSSTPAWFFSTDPSSSNLVYRKVTWSGGTPSFTAKATLTTSLATLSLPNAPALSSATPINTGDVRLLSATIRNNRLWTARNVAVNSAGTAGSADRVACEWFEINVSAAVPTLVQNGRVFDTAVSDPRFYYYPAIMVNGQGHAVMAFSGSKSTEFVGAYYCGRLASDTANTMGDPILFKAGTGSYVQNDGSGRNRWGDYSHTTLDPNDNQSLWTVQEYAETNGSVVGGTTSRWGTQIAKMLSLAPTLNVPATLDVQPGNTGVTLNLTGTNFYDPGAGFPNRLAAQITGGSPNGITNVVTTYNGPTSVSVTFDVAANAGGGARGVTLTNPDGQSASIATGVNVVVAATTTLDFSSATYAVAEGTANATITVNRSGVLSGASTVTYSTQPGTASAGSDYTTTTNTLSFSAGQTSKTFDIPIVNDNLLETTETVNLSLSNPTGGTLGATSAAQLSISNNATPPKPTGLSATVLSLTSVSLAWTDNCGNETGVQVERKAGAGSYALLTTTAANATTAMDSGPFIPGTTYTYRVRAINGLITSDYSNESSAALTTLEFASATASIAESGGTASLTVNRTGDTSGAASVTVSVSGGSATPATDYTVPGATLTFSGGQSTRTVSVPVQADNLLEGDETVVITLSAPTGTGVVLGSQTTTTLTITDNLSTPAPSGLTASVQAGAGIALSWTDNCGNDTGVQVERKVGAGSFSLLTTAGANATSSLDSGPFVAGTLYTYRVRALSAAAASAYSNESSATVTSIEFASATASIGEGGTAMLTVNRTGSTAGSASVTVSVTGGTAVPATDFTVPSVNVSFSAGQSSQTVSIPSAADLLLEGDETVVLTLSSPTGTGVVLGSQTTSTLTITDDVNNPAPTGLTATVQSGSQISLSWTDHCANETGYEVERSSAGGGFSLITSLPPGSTSYLDGLLSRGVAYSYRVRAVRPGLASGYSNTANVTIDGIQLSSGAFSVSEEDGAVSITVSRTGAAVGSVSVDYATSQGTATDGSDYTGIQGTLTFGNGETTKTLVVSVANDGLIEAAETFTVTLSNPVGIGLGTTTAATTTISDNASATKPASLTATILGVSLVRLNWQDNSNNETGFRVERKVGAGSFVTLASVGAGVVTYTDNTAAALDTAYTYRVVAIAGVTETAPSNEATVTIASGGKATISPKSLAFGKVKIGKSKAKTLKIKNTGNGVLQGFVGSLDSRFVVLAGAGSFTLTRNQTHTVQVSYSPTMIETISTVMVITTTDPKKASTNVKVTAKGG